MLGINAAHLIAKQADILMLGAIRSTSEVGLYSAASKISDLIIFGLVVSNAVLAPMISGLYGKEQIGSLQSLITLAARATFIVTVVCFIGILLFGQWMLGLYGAAFRDAYYPLVILSFGQFINAASGPVGFLMTMTGRHFHAAIIVGISALANVGANAILIPLWGMGGAALATALTSALWNLSMVYYVVQVLGLHPTPIGKRV
jgi:O-antigen/teichoic acid export membrane protein